MSRRNQRSDREYRGDQRRDEGGFFSSGDDRGQQDRSFVERILPGSAGESDEARRGGDRPNRGDRGQRTDWPNRDRERGFSGRGAERHHHGRHEQETPPEHPDRAGQGAPGGSEIDRPREQTRGGTHGQQGQERSRQQTGTQQLTGVGAEHSQPTAVPQREANDRHSIFGNEDRSMRGGYHHQGTQHSQLQSRGTHQQRGRERRHIGGQQQQQTGDRSEQHQPIRPSHRQQEPQRGQQHHTQRGHRQRGSQHGQQQQGSQHSGHRHGAQHGQQQGGHGGHRHQSQTHGGHQHTTNQGGSQTGQHRAGGGHGQQANTSDQFLVRQADTPVERELDRRQSERANERISRGSDDDGDAAHFMQSRWNAGVFR